LRYRGRDVLWAYGEHEHDEALPVVIVPYDKIAAAADSVAQQVIRRARAGLRLRGALSLGVAGVVILIAVWASRCVTRPVSQLAVAATKLAEGDYGAQVDIRTGDELEELGHVFNDVAPKLGEREKMKQSLELAKEIQQNLLPKNPPQLEGFDIAGEVVYCDETGGDYYDFIELVELGPGKLGVAVGDVTGHGIGPALLMATARGVLRSHAALHGPDVGQLLSTLNTHLVKDTQDGRFMTLFYALLDSEARSFYYASGGHDPALWFRQDQGQIEELHNTGMLVGVFDESEFGTVGPTQMAKGDVVVVTTDGIPEAHGAADQLFGRERLAEVVTAHAKESAGDIHRAIMQSVADFSGEVPRRDDITLVVIKAS